MPSKTAPGRSPAISAKARRNNVADYDTTQACRNFSRMMGTTNSSVTALQQGHQTVGMAALL
jgi:hypothetical protein